jgi:RNA polymerase sigma-70 factor (ECF subfamily)
MPARDAAKSHAEKELVAGCVGGDATAWRGLIAQYGALIAHAARTTLSRCAKIVDANLVEEATQAIWAALCEDGCRRLRSFGGQSALSTWLTVLSTRRTLDFIRVELRKGVLRNVHLEHEDADLISEIKDPNPPPEPRGEDEMNLLFGAMERLPVEDKLVLKMYYLDGLSYRSIAKALRVAPNTISSYIFRAREKLKAQMAKPE